MQRKNPFLSSFAIAAALAAPSAMLITSGLNAQVGVSIRIYDRDHKDYHNWDDREDRAYRVYLNEHRRDYVEYKHLKKNEQRDYWRWRHEHPDHDEHHER